MAVELDQAIAWASGRKNAVLITLRNDGRAQSSDITYLVTGGTIVISLTATRAKTANMRRDPRVILHITDPGSWSYLSFDAVADLGPVTTAKDDEAADDLVDYYRSVAGEHDDWDEYRSAMVSEQRQLLRLRPTSVVGQINS